MNNTRFLKIVIVLLILVNLGMMAFIWFNSPVSKPSDQPPFAPGFLVKELELSGSQQKNYLGLRGNHRKILGQLQERDKILHTRFFDQLFSEVPDSKSVQALVDSITENRRKMEVLTFDHFMQVRQMLTPDQQKKFEEIFEEVLRMVLPPPPPPPSGIAPPPPPPLPPPGK